MSDDMKNYVPDFEHIRRLADGLEKHTIAIKSLECTYRPIEIFPSSKWTFVDGEILKQHMRDRKDLQ